MAVSWKSDQVQGTIAVDLKMANIISGPMTHSCTYPCTWCVSKRGQLEKKSQLWTINQNYSKWRKSKGTTQNAKNFINCVNRPFFSSTSQQLILDVIPPPELHLLVGVVNTLYLYNHMLNEFNRETLAWVKSCHVEPDRWNGGSGFNWNACKTLLNKLDIIRGTCPVQSLKYVKVLENFRMVVSSCFGKVLDPKFKQDLRNFKHSYLDFYHVEEFCAKQTKELWDFIANRQWRQSIMNFVRFGINTRFRPKSQRIFPTFMESGLRIQ